MSVVITAERPDSADAIALITALEAHLAPQYPSESRHGLSVDQLLEQQVAFFVLRADGDPVACGGVKLFGTEYGEVKRMYARPEYRGRGYAKAILDHLAEHARDQGVSLLRLETGIYQTDAIGLYEHLGFTRIPPFGEYKLDPLSIFFEKQIRGAANKGYRASTRTDDIACWRMNAAYQRPLAFRRRSRVCGSTAIRPKRRR